MNREDRAIRAFEDVVNKAYSSHRNGDMYVARRLAYGNCIEISQATAEALLQRLKRNDVEESVDYWIEELFTWRRK